MNIKLTNAPTKRCPPHTWVFKARLEGKSTKKICRKCGKVNTGIHGWSFYGMGGHGEWQMESKDWGGE